MTCGERLWSKTARNKPNPNQPNQQELEFSPLSTPDSLWAPSFLLKFKWNCYFKPRGRKCLQLKNSFQLQGRTPKTSPLHDLACEVLLLSEALLTFAWMTSGFREGAHIHFLGFRSCSPHPEAQARPSPAPGWLVHNSVRTPYRAALPSLTGRGLASWKCVQRLSPEPWRKMSMVQVQTTVKQIFQEGDKWNAPSGALPSLSPLRSCSWSCSSPIEGTQGCLTGFLPVA